MILFKHFAIKKFEDGGIVGIDLTHVSPDTSTGESINPTHGDRAFEKGGKVDSSMIGSSGHVNGKMALIMGESDDKNKIKIVQEEDEEYYEKGGIVMADEVRGYCMATKTKNVKMHDVVLKKTAKGGYMAQGHDGKGHKMTAMLSKEKGQKLIKK
jgi:hypothetical protein